MCAVLDYLFESYKPSDPWVYIGSQLHDDGNQDRANHLNHEACVIRLLGNFSYPHELYNLLEIPQLGKYMDLTIIFSISIRMTPSLYLKHPTPPVFLSSLSTSHHLLLSSCSIASIFLRVAIGYSSSSKRPRVDSVGASVVLDGARSLKCSSLVYKGVAVYGKGTVRTSGLRNRRWESTKVSGEGLNV